MRSAWPCLVVLAIACSSSGPPDGVPGDVDGATRIVGSIDGGYGFADVIVSPDTVEATTSFAAIINTFGSPSCTTPDGVALQVNSGSATVTPYDRVPPGYPNTICTRDFAARAHPINLTFSTPGLRTIIVHGRSGGDGAGPELTVTKTIVVVPQIAR